MTAYEIDQEEKPKGGCLIYIALTILFLAARCAGMI